MDVGAIFLIEELFKELFSELNESANSIKKLIIQPIIIRPTIIPMIMNNIFFLFVLHCFNTLFLLRRLTKSSLIVASPNLKSIIDQIDRSN